MDEASTHLIIIIDNEKFACNKEKKCFVYAVLLVVHTGSLKIRTVYFSHWRNSVPSGGLTSTFFAPTSFQFVLNTVPPSKKMYLCTLNDEYVLYMEIM